MGNEKMDRISELFTPGFLLLLALALCLNACQKKDEAKEKPLPQSSAVTPTPLPHNLSNPLLRANVVPLPSPNGYQVALEWSTQEADPEIWVLLRQDVAYGLKQIAVLDSTTKKFTDTAVLAGEKYQYKIAALDGEQYKVREQVEVTIPQDLLIQGEKEYQEISGINRLFFADKSQILASGEYLRIEVNEIIAKDGSIATFAENQIAALGVRGRSGGTIIIRSKSGSGTLQVIARGENGGPGVSGGVGVEGQKGADGAPCQHRYQFKPLPESEIRKVLPGLPVGHPFWRQAYACEKSPTNGQRGSNGGPGANGGTGGNGGNSGKIYVEIQNPSAIQIKPQVIAGNGGPGGPGGKGAAPGAGGKAGASDPHGICPPASDGAPGLQGPQGQPGLPGVPGYAEPFCLKLGTAIFGDCSAFTVRNGKIY